MNVRVSALAVVLTSLALLTPDGLAQAARPTTAARTATLQLQVSAHYFHAPPQEVLSGGRCVVVSEEDREKISPLVGRTGKPGLFDRTFCITNEREFLAALQPPTRFSNDVCGYRADVDLVLADFTPRGERGTARFVKLVRPGTYQPEPCSGW